MIFGLKTTNYTPAATVRQIRWLFGAFITPATSKILDFNLTPRYNNCVGFDDKDVVMYTVLFPSGKTLTFSVKALAETYVVAYRGVLIGDTVIVKEVEVV